MTTPEQFESRTEAMLATLCLLVGIAAVIGGFALVAWPDGSALRMQTAVLEPSPFSSFLIPGLVLLFVIGFGSLIAGALFLEESRLATRAAALSGLLLLGWIVIQMAMLQTINGLQIGCFATAVAIIALAWRHYLFTSGREPRAPNRGRGARGSLRSSPAGHA